MGRLEAGSEDLRFYGCMRRIISVSEPLPQINGIYLVRYTFICFDANIVCTVQLFGMDYSWEAYHLMGCARHLRGTGCYGG